MESFRQDEIDDFIETKVLTTCFQACLAINSWVENRYGETLEIQVSNILLRYFSNNQFNFLLIQLRFEQKMKNKKGILENLQAEIAKNFQEFSQKVLTDI